MKNWLIAFVLLLASCQSSQAPVVAHASLLAASGEPLLDVRFDGDTFVGFGAGVGVCEVFGKVTGFPIYGPVGLSSGRIYVSSRSRKFNGEFMPGEPLPAWVKDSGIFRQGEAETLGLTFEVAP